MRIIIFSILFSSYALADEINPEFHKMMLELSQNFNIKIELQKLNDSQVSFCDVEKKVLFLNEKTSKIKPLPEGVRRVISRDVAVCWLKAQ